MHKFGQTKAIIESPKPQTAKKPDGYSDTKSSSSPVLTSVACSHYKLSKLQAEKRNVEVAATAVDEDADAAPPTYCQSEAATQAPSSYPWYQQGASPLHEEENAELLHKVNRLREIAHHYNDEVEEWFGKYVKYKGHEETRITCLLQRHFPLSNIAGLDLAQDKIIHLWDVQRRRRTIEAEKEKKRQQVKEAALASNARRSLNIY